MGKGSDADAKGDGAPAGIPANYRQVIDRFERLPRDVRGWIPGMAALIQGYDWEVSIAFVFARIEASKHVALYRGLVKRHRVDAKLTWTLLEKDHMSRSRFEQLFATVFGSAMPADLRSRLATAEAVRDRVMHGKAITDLQARTALTAAFDFMEGFNDLVFRLAAFKPYGDGRGFKGRGENLSAETSRWVLKGMGIPGGRE